MPESTAGKSAARPVVTVAGAELSERVAAALRSVTVDSDAAGPDSCRLVLDDPLRDLLAGSGVDLACDLTVTAGPLGHETGQRLFDGVVYGIGFEFDERGSWTTVSAYDRSYGLHNGLHTRTYQNVTDSDLAGQIAQEVGLEIGDVDPTDLVHEHLSQVNETYIRFLRRRAGEVGRVLRVVGRRLDFVARPDAARAPEPGDRQSTGRLQLVPGANLQRLTVRVSAAQQVREVEVRGWDPATKAGVVATATGVTTSAELRDTPASLARVNGDPRLVDVDVPLTQQAACEALAAARAEHVASAHVHAEGVAFGDPALVAGAAVSLGATGGRFDGRVTLTRATHTWDSRGYRTAFLATGSHDRSVLGLVAGESGRGHGDRLGGLVVGVVTNVTDPDGLARVKVRLPWLDAEYESDWVRVLQLGAGPDRGLLVLPEVEDEVVLAFEHGDPRRPFVLGGLWNGQDAPPRDVVDAATGEVTARLWRSRAGHEVVLDDADSGGGVTVRVAGGRAAVTLGADGTVSVHADGDLTMEVKGAGLLKATGELALESAQKVRVKAPQIALN